RRRGVGLRALNPERASAGFTLFSPLIWGDGKVYLIDLHGDVVHTWNMPYPPGLSGYLTERGTLFYNGRTSEDSFLNRFPFKGGVVLEADWNGKVLWEVRHPDHHHHGVLLRNGNVLLNCMGRVPDEIARRVKGGVEEDRFPSGQHAPTPLGNGHSLIFDNGVHRLDDSMPFSRVIEVDPATNKIAWKYQDRPAWNFFSPRMGNAQRLPNGNTLVCESSFGRFFEV